MSPIDPLEATAVASAPTLLPRLEETLGRAPGSDLAAAARELGLSRRTLQRACAREGVAFQAVRNRVRLGRAESLLDTTDLKVASIAGEIGFSSTAHFIAWFRDQRGLTPGAWRSRAPPPPSLAMT